MNKSLTDAVTFRHGATVHNRIVVPPMLTNSGSEGGFATEDTINYYSARSQAAGIIIVEYHYVSEEGGPCTRIVYPEQLGIYTDEHTESIQKIAQAIKKDGNKAILQIHHGGREAIGQHEKGGEVLVPSAKNFPFLSYPIRRLTDSEIRRIIDDFGEATRRAIEAGFDGVEIHGANHYLLQQFFSAYSNVREDHWGGTLEKRMNFPLEVVKKVKAVVDELAPDDFIVGYRISPEEIHEENIGYTYKESKKLISKIIQHELDYIHLSLPAYDVKPTGETKTTAELIGEALDDNTKLIIVGGVRSEAAAIDALQHTDLVAVGKGTLIDPEFGKKIDEGRGDEIVSEISEEQFKKANWTPGLLQVFTDEYKKHGHSRMPNIERLMHLRD